MNKFEIVKINTAEMADKTQLQPYLDTLASLQLEWSIENRPNADIDRLRELNSEFLEDSVDAGDIYFLAVNTETRQAVGFGIVEHAIDGTNTLNFGLAYVQPEHRRQGILSQMTNDVILTAKELGASSITAYTNDAGISEHTLLKRGFVEYDRENFPDGSHQSYLRLTLSPGDIETESYRRFIP